MQKRQIFVTTALPYANGPFHIGHIMEYIQADIWVRTQRMYGHTVCFVGADDTHGAPMMIAAQKAGIEKYNLTEYPVVKSPIEELFAEFTTEVKARLLKEELGTFYTTWEQMKNKVENQGLLARIPYDIAFN